METTVHKQQPEMRENAPITDADIHSVLDVHTSQEVTSFVDETPQQQVEPSDEKPVAASANPIMDQTLLDILKRPRIISSFKWSATNAVGSWMKRLVLPDELFKSNTIWSKLQQYVYLHAGLKFMFRINGTAYHYGTLAAIWRPIALGKTCVPSSIRRSSYDSLYPLLQYPHALISPSSSQNVEMSAPYQCPIEKIPIKAFSEDGQMRQWANLGVLDILVLNPLRAGPRSADTPDVTVDVYASFENPSLFGYTHQHFDFLPVLYALPRYTMLPTALRFPMQVTQAKVDESKEENKDLVKKAQEPVVYLPPKLQSSDYNQPSYHLSLTKKPFFSPLDSTLLTEHLSQWCLLHQFDCQTNTAVDSILAAYKVLPQNCGVGTPLGPLGRAYFHTKLSYLSSLFRFWRGPLEYRFDFISSKFHSCRVKIAWYPPGTVKQASNYDLGDTWTKVVDIQGDISVTFTVPFIEPVAYLPYAPTSLLSNGTIVISLLNSLAYPVPNGPPITCNVWIRGPELELSGFVNENAPPRLFLGFSDPSLLAPNSPWPGIPGTYPNPKAIEEKSIKQVAQAGPITPHPFVTEDLNRLLHKPTPLVYLTAGQRYYSSCGSLYPVTDTQFKSGVGQPHLALSLLDYLFAIHIGYRGSVRYVSAYPDGELFVVAQSRPTAISAVYADKSTVPSLLLQYSNAIHAFFPSNEISLKDFSVPMYTSLSFRPFLMEVDSANDTPVTFPALEATCTAGIAPLYVSAAEDFSFIGIGACPITFRWPFTAEPA